MVANTKGTDCAFPTGADGDPGLTKREHFAALNYAAILGKIAFDQPAEDMMRRAGIEVSGFEQFAARLAVSGANATIAALNEDASLTDAERAAVDAEPPECAHDYQPTGNAENPTETRCTKCGDTMPF